jgi:N-acetylmuramoyl-L-alanine amidase
MRSFGRTSTVCALAVLCLPGLVRAQSAKSLYERALSRENVLRGEVEVQRDRTPGPLLDRMRQVVEQYERLVHRYPRSGYSDNALYNAALLSADAYAKFGDEADRRAAMRLFKSVRSQYPSSSLEAQVNARLKQFEMASKAPPPARAAAPPAATAGERPLLAAIKREVLRDTLRVTLELGREAVFHEERIDGPPRVFIDLRDTRVANDLRDATLAFPDDVVRTIRVGRQQGAARVVLDLEGAARHSVYTLYNPYRVVIDFERPAPVANVAKDEPGAAWTPEPVTVPATAPSREEPRLAPPVTNRDGSFSLSRQLGLGISRVVIDAGHGGHDPGARVKGLNEADLTLDIALRLENLLLKVPGVEVVMTRRTNVYIPLDERTAIANRAGADLFLSIHANASNNSRARGIETYFLNFAPNPEAEALAARENAGSAKTMHHLPDIVRAIALNNKIDESRDFASLVQSSMFDRLRKSNRQARNLGVKQAPFMVLIGATMPSVLAEISFITHRQEGALLKTDGYRQAIAEALSAGVLKYQRSLKAPATVVGAGERRKSNGRTEDPNREP